MAGKRILLVLAVGVLLGSFAGWATANEQGVDAYGPWDKSLSADPERSFGQPEVGESEMGASREPMETGAVPDRPESSSDVICCTGGGDPTFNLGGP